MCLKFAATSRGIPEVLHRWCRQCWL